jgi:hypothetical protein
MAPQFMLFAFPLTAHAEKAPEYFQLLFNYSIIIQFEVGYV